MSSKRGERFSNGLKECLEAYSDVCGELIDITHRIETVEKLLMENVPSERVLEFLKENKL